MLCPFCNYNETQVIDSRDTENLEAIRRRRECLKCHKRFTTYERVETIGIRVVKKDGSQEEFDINKLYRGVAKACEKTSVTPEQIKKVVDAVTAEVRNYKSTEIPSKKVGRIIMKYLKKVDKVAYVRFASVYREFKDLEDFEEELVKLLKNKK